MNDEIPSEPFSRFSLRGRTAVITGVGPGMGSSIARAYASAGAAVVLCARTEARVQELAQEIRERGGAAHVVVADMSKEGDVVELVDAALSEYGRIDVLFNNAHVNVSFAPTTSEANGSATPNWNRMPDRGCLDMTRDDWIRGLDVNVYAPYRLAQLIVPHMRRQGAGSIINMISSAAEEPGRPEMVVYGATKAALATLTRYLAKECAPEIRVNALCPGAMTETGEVTPLFEPVVKSIPLRRLGRSDEIVGAALFLASDASSYMTGEVLRTDGGRLHAR